MPGGAGGESGGGPDFPLARQHFWPAASESGDEPAASQPPVERPRLGVGRAPHRPGLSLSIPNLSALRAEEAPPSEMQLRREKLAHFDKQCSRVADGLFVGSDTVARSREALAAAGVTHVLNATAFASANYFCAPAGAPPGAPAAADGGPALAYKPLWLQDTPGEDLGCVLYDVFDWLDGVRDCGGSALVHCSQGVSRSVALCIAYLMWRDGEGYDDAFARVKAARGVANPNMGFACQLLQWAKRRCAPPDGARLYRIAPHSAADPRYLVPRQASRPLVAALDARFAYVVHAPDALYIWRGAACTAPFVAAACAVAAQLAKYEAAPLPVRCVDCGSEPAELLDALGVPPEARGPDGAGLTGAATLRVAAFDDELALHASGRRCDLALRAGVAAQEQALAVAAAGGGPLLPRCPPEEEQQSMRTARMSLPSAFSTARCGDSTAVRRPRGSARLSSPGFGFNMPPFDVRIDEHPASPEEEDEDTGSQLFAFPSLERLMLFDADDLQPSGAYVLLSPEGSVHVWLGAEHAQQLGPGDAPQATAARVAAAAAAGGVPVPCGAPVQVELDGSESAAFWNAFET